jgi:hypothetical protein
MQDRDVQPSQTVISGHSLGAQIAAFASNEAARPDCFGESLHAILAADPAGPMFELATEAERLDPTDAKEVMVVHTTKMFGDENAVGTLDIYVDWTEADNDPIVQHSRARELVTQSFRQPTMCNEDGTPFGINAVLTQSHLRGVRTFEQAPSVAAKAEPAELTAIALATP